MLMKQGILCAALLGITVYLKLCLPGFAEEYMPLLHGWLGLEQVVIPLPEEAMAWLVLR